MIKTILFDLDGTMLPMDPRVHRLYFLYPFYPLANAP